MELRSIYVITVNIYVTDAISIAWIKGSGQMSGAKRKYIEAAYELLVRDGLDGVSIRKVADEVGCSSAALYRHFPDIDKLIAVASMRFFRDYIEDASVLSKVDLNPLELNLQLWECLAYYSFRNADVFENLFFGNADGSLYTEAAAEYFEQYPEDLVGLKDFMLDMFKNATISERDSILLNRAAEYGMLTKDAAAYLCKVDSYLYRGMLSDVRGRDLAEDDFRWVTREFMDLIIRGYMTQLEEGCSILVVKPDFVAAKSDSDVDARSSYRVKIIPMEYGTAKERRKATA